MKKVCIESPLKGLDGNYERNVRYSRLCGLDCIRRGEAPFAGHLLMTQFLDDTDPEQRKVGIEAHLAWAAAAEVVAIYQDLGVSPGMKLGADAAAERGQEVEFRNLPPDLMARLDGSMPDATPGMGA